VIDRTNICIFWRRAGELAGRRAAWVRLTQREMTKPEEMRYAKAFVKDK
jgi:hypothetical protein